MPEEEKRFLIQTLLYFMNFEVKGIADRLKHCLDELLAKLQTIYDHDQAEVHRIYALASPSLWEYYEIAGITGQREQELLNGAKRRVKESIREAVRELTKLERTRVKDKFYRKSDKGVKKQTIELVSDVVGNNECLKEEGIGEGCRPQECDPRNHPGNSSPQCSQQP